MMDFLTGFLQDCQARGLTPHTIETYSSNARAFLEAFPEPYSVGLDNLKAFLGELRARGLQGSTLKGYFASISAFYDYLVFEGRHNINPIPSFRKRYLSRLKEQHNGENTRQLISTQDMSLLVSAAPGILEKALILTLAKTGMRRGELLSLRVDDIDLKRQLIRIPPKAKRTNRLAYMDEELRDILEQYLAWRKTRANTAWLWISSRGGRIHKDEPNRIIEELGAALDLHDPAGPISKRLTCHCLRHWFTTWLFRAGMNPEYIKWLRGDSLRAEAWQIYNHIDAEAVRTEYLRCIPHVLHSPHCKNIAVRGSNTNLNPVRIATR